MSKKTHCTLLLNTMYHCVARVWQYVLRPQFHQCTHPTDNPAIIHGPSKSSSWFCLPSLEFVPKSGNSLKKYVTVPYVPLVSRDHGRILFKFKPFGNVVPILFYTMFAKITEFPLVSSGPRSSFVIKVSKNQNDFMKK